MQECTCWWRQGRPSHETNESELLSLDGDAIPELSVGTRTPTAAAAAAEAAPADLYDLESGREGSDTIVVHARQGTYTEEEHRKSGSRTEPSRSELHVSVPKGLGRLPPRTKVSVCLCAVRCRFCGSFV